SNLLRDRNRRQYMTSGIDSVMTETRVFGPFERIAATANVSGMEAYQQLYDEADQDPTGFWGRMAKEHLIWEKPFNTVLNESDPPSYRWFEDGELNGSASCLDKHPNTPRANKTAIIFEADDGTVTRVTYKELHERVCKLANGIKSLGHQ